MENYRKIQALLMRGGTSKGAYILAEELPTDLEKCDKAILEIYGSPDKRQISGIGGADPLTSKVCLVEKSKRADADVSCTFGYVGVEEPFVDYDGNCGNMLAGVGPFAVYRGLVPLQEPFTIVRIYNTNTKKIIEATVPVHNGDLVVDGDCAISGVPGTGAKIALDFLDAGGSRTGRLLPTGRVRDEIALTDGRIVMASIVDAAIPAIFVQASDVQFSGAELPNDWRIQEILTVMEDIRTAGAVLCGLAADRMHVSPAIPKVALVAAPMAYTNTAGQCIEASQVDLLARTKALGGMHKVYAVTGGICLAAAAMIPGTVVYDLTHDTVRQQNHLRIGHPAGVMTVSAEVERVDGAWRLRHAGLVRTAKPIMDGIVFIHKSLYDN